MAEQTMTDNDRKLVILDGNAPYDDTDFLWATYVEEELIDAGGGPLEELDAVIEAWENGEDWQLT